MLVALQLLCITITRLSSDIILQNGGHHSMTHALLGCPCWVNRRKGALTSALSPINLCKLDDLSPGLLSPFHKGPWRTFNVPTETPGSSAGLLSRGQF
ncbi:hypothetical protein F5Y08DRAFT_257378 [Xylaria arbuscula]|nr:hypothetical protein F5Y08DRAFT_257378 [Xylaria arbuscula]